MNAIKFNFTIRDLENISGIKAHTIRIWEKRHNFLQPKRSKTNIRYYTNQDLLKLLNIVLLNKNGVKLSKIALMTDENIKSQAKIVVSKVNLDDEAIHSFKLAMFTFDVFLFQKMYLKLLDEKSFSEIFKETFIPFLRQIGLLWQTKTLLPAHEHFISNLITQKIQSNIEKLELKAKNTDLTYVLFLPENEIHELGLLYLNYELILKGKKTIYLGQNLSLDNLDHFFNNKEKICFITVLTVRPYEDEIVDYFLKIDKKSAVFNHQFIAVGNKTRHIKNYPFVTDIKSFPTILDLLEVL